MSKKHDENKCLKSFARVGRVHISDKTLSASKSAVIGIHLWGKIDYLCHYCGWRFFWDNNSGTGGWTDGDKPTSRELKKQKRESKIATKQKVVNKRK